MPGGGKTVTASIVVDYLKGRFDVLDRRARVIFLYCSHTSLQEQTPVNMLASILKQLVQAESTIPDTLGILYDIHLDLGTRPTLDDIFEILTSKLFSQRRIFLIVDALDEYMESDRSIEEGTLISKLLILSHEAAYSLITTSRFIPPIMKLFKDHPRIEIRANDADLEKFLRQRMGGLAACVRKSPSLQSTIRSVIINAIDGM
jgi:hypothetical protein